MSNIINFASERAKRRPDQDRAIRAMLLQRAFNMQEEAGEEYNFERARAQVAQWLKNGK